MQSHLRQPQSLKGIGRFEEKAWLATEGVGIYDESSANRGRKSPLTMKKSAGFQPLFCLIYGFHLI